MQLDHNLAVRMLHQAKHFRNTTVILHDKIHVANESNFFTPYATICTLTIELYLKAIIYIETLRPHIMKHEVAQLFTKLPEDTQAEIERLYIATIPENQFPIRELLERSSKAFEEYRYFYEHPDPGGFYLTYEIINASISYLRTNYTELIIAADNMIVRLHTSPPKK